MKISVRAGKSPELQTQMLVLPWYQASTKGRGRGEAVLASLTDLDALLGGTLGRVVDSGDFTGKKGQSLLLYGPAEGGPARVLLVGLGVRADVVGERWREAGGHAAGQAADLGVGELSVHLGAEQAGTGLGVEAATRAVVEGLVLGSWRFEEMRGKEKETWVQLSEATLVLDAGSAVEAISTSARIGEKVASGQNFARELAVRPGNIATPAFLATTAEELGESFGLDVKVMGPAELAAEGMRAILAVAAGSAQEPRFIALEYKGGGGEPLVLVGKGVTFDSGGLSLKSASGMESMKYDMSGAAAVLGALQAIGELKPKVNVVGLIPSVENLPSARAMRPGDVIEAHSGTTIEILNTDAEGRLILADALSYAARYTPRAMVDIATLTGACVIALGHEAIGMMGTNDDLLAQLDEAADRSGERVWELPLWDEYREQIKSDIADIKNTGGRPAGTITAAMFLREFVGSIPWAHLDIAGTAWANESSAYQPKGPTGVGVRLFTEWVLRQAG